MSSSPSNVRLPWWLRSQLGAYVRGVQDGFRRAQARATPVYLIALLVLGSLGTDDGVAVAVGARGAAIAVGAAAWVALLAFARRAFFADPQALYLRCLPVSRRIVIGVSVAAMVALDVPWIALCAMTGAPDLAVLGPVLTLAGHLAVAAGAAWSIAGFAAVLGLAAVAPWWLAAAAGVALAAATAGKASVRVRARRVRALPAVHIRVAWIGLARALMVAPAREDRELAPRLAVAVLVGVAAAWLAARNNDFAGSHAVRASLIAMTLTFAVASARAAAHIIGAGAQLRWLVAATGNGRVAACAAAATAAAAYGGAFGLAHAAALRALGVELAALGWSAHVAWGTACGLGVLGIASWAQRTGELDPNRLFAGTLAGAVVACFAVGAGAGAAVAGAAAACAFGVASYAAFHGARGAVAC